MKYFSEYKTISELINTGNLMDARAKLIRLLDAITRDSEDYDPILNHLLREVGLYQYIHEDNADFIDVYAANMFRAPIGESEYAIFHKEQAYILKKLLRGDSIVVSAPTSFGKSYVIDAFIAMRKPHCSVIIVPTVALANETRRRLAHKFSSVYNIITTTDGMITDRDIFIFPQERVFAYIGILQSIDILIVDEFYKVSLPDERADRLLSAIIELGKVAKQKYFLGPNIDGIKDNPISAGMEFINENDFKTVLTLSQNTYEKKALGEDTASFKRRMLPSIISSTARKTLVYAGSHRQIGEISRILQETLPISSHILCREFSDWLKINYGRNCVLIPLIERGVGLHNGNIHRALAQIQLRLFEVIDGIQAVVSTSSIIEGVNTQAEQVVIWNSGISNKKLDYFTYRNIVGRAGRMFKFFIGYVYLLEEAPKATETQLEIPFSDDVICNLDEKDPGVAINSKQRAKIIEYNHKLEQLVGERAFNRLKQSSAIKGASPRLVLQIAEKLVANPLWPKEYDNFTSKNPYYWRTPIEDIAEFLCQPNEKSEYKIALWKLSNNWNTSIAEICDTRLQYHINPSRLFKIERDISYKVPNLLSIIHEIKMALGIATCDIGPFIKLVSNSFLPKNVFELEEYGLPRMISKKIHTAGLIDLEAEIPMSAIINQFKNIGLENLIGRLPSLHPMDKFILKYFYEGI